MRCRISLFLFCLLSLFHVARWYKMNLLIQSIEQGHLPAGMFQIHETGLILIGIGILLLGWSLDTILPSGFMSRFSSRDDVS